MKNRIYLKLMALMWAMLLVACSADYEEQQYHGPGFVQFADSAYVMPVTEGDTVFEVPVAITSTMNRDASFAVVVDQKCSNAVEGYHFELESHNVVIPAGQHTASVRLHGHYDHITSVNDSLCVTLRLLTDEANLSPLYGSTTQVHLQKVRPFRIQDYVGDMQITCTFPYSTSAVTRYLVKTEMVDEHTLRIKKPFDDTRDITVTFHDNRLDPLNQDITVREQVAFTDESFGPVSMKSVAGIPSYYLPEDRAFVLYLEAYLAQLGSFGTYYYIFQWVSPDEALAVGNGLNTLY